MKRVIICILAAILITIIIPLAVVEFAAPQHNADSTAPRPADGAAEV